MTFYLEREQSLIDDVLVVRLEGVPDPDLLDTLNAEQRRYQLKYPLKKAPPKNRYRILPNNTTAILQAIAATGQLKWGDKNIVCDFYGKNSLTFLVDDDMIIGQVQTRNSLIEISDSPFIGRGSPHCFLDGITLRFLTTDLPWKVLKKIYTLAPLPTLEEVKACVIEDDPETPDIEYISSRESEPLPLLKLKDGSGAFADLWLADGTPGLGSQWEKDLLETGFTKRPNEYFCPLDKVWDALSFLLEMGWEIQDCQGKKLKLAGEPTFTVEQREDHMIINGSIPYGEEKASLSSLAGNNSLFIPLSENSIGLIPKSTEIEHLAQEGELVAEGVKLKQTQALSFESFLKRLDLDLFQPPQKVVVGDLFHGTLRPYQQAGVEWLTFLRKNRFHGILADDMGLGKTVQVLAYLATEDNDRPSLCVMPTSLLYNWKNEAKTFFPTLPVILHHGPERSKTTLPEKGLILTSYGTLLRDKELFKTSDFQCIFLDEAQVIKNRRTQQFQAVCELNAELRLCITGTPVENRAEELFTHFHFLIPDLLTNCDPQETARVKRKSKPFILRRRKEEVAADLPEKIEQNVWISMPDDQRLAYDQFLSSSQQNLINKVRLDGAGKHRMEIFETLLRLRQICCHPSLVNGQKGTSGKLEALLNDLETIQEEGKKALVFSQFTSMLSLIKKGCVEREWDFCYLDGQTKDRAEQVKKFQEDPDLPFFLISLKAGGVGLNLTAADYVLLFDPWWNPAVEQQAIDRAHRIGRKDTVIAKRYLCLDSVEEKMLHLNEKKRQLADQLLDDTSESPALSEDDLYFLLES